jgi:Tat protein translocase TatB subunit
MFGTLGGPEILLLVVLALIVFGPRKLPEIGKSMGRMLAEFRRASNDFKRTIEDEVEAEKIREAMAEEPPAAAALPLPAPQPAAPAADAEGATPSADAPASAPPDAPPADAAPVEPPPAEPPSGAAEDVPVLAPPAESVSRE